MPAKATSPHAKASPDSNGQELIRAVGYARVSSRVQQKRESIKTQIEQIRRHCETQGWHLEKIYTDDGQSGMLRFDQRPGARQLLTDARHGRFNLAIVVDFDRLGREGEVSYVAKNLLSSLG